MLGITILAVGKIKEKFYRDAIDEYSKRLTRYCKFSIYEVKDEPMSERPEKSEIDAVLKKEGERLKEKIPKNAYLVSLCIEGRKTDSVGFSEIIESAANCGKSEIVFVIGGSLGICDEIKNLSDLKLSFSDMTFPHQLMRVILSEQLYRAFNILSGGKYHK